MKSANVFSRILFYLSHKAKGHEIGIYSKSLAKGFLFTVDCKDCKTGIMTVFQ